MLHRDCKTPQLPDNELDKYLLKVQAQTLPVESHYIIDAKEERKRKVKEASALPSAPVKASKSKKHSKHSENTTKLLVVQPNEQKVKVIQLLLHMYHVALNILIMFLTIQNKVIVVPPVVFPPAKLPPDVLQTAVTVSQRSLDAAPVTHDPRDAHIAVLEKAVQSLQSTVHQMQSTATTVSANFQHRPPPPTNSFSQYASNHEMAIRTESNRWLGESENNFPSCSNNEPDEFFNFYFRMQQHNTHSHQSAMQSTIERLELENYLHVRQLNRNNQQRQWSYNK